MILFAASFKIPSKNDRPLFISISSNRQPDPCQSFSTPSSKTRFESNRRNTVQWFPASPPRISLNLVFLSCAPRTRARTQTHSYIRVWWPWLYLRRRKRRITLNLSPLLVISRDHETETKTRAGPEWLTRAPPPPSWYLTRFRRWWLPWSTDTRKHAVFEHRGGEIGYGAVVWRKKFFFKKKKGVMRIN